MPLCPGQEVCDIRDRRSLDWELEPLGELDTISKEQIDRLKSELIKELPSVRFLHKENKILIVHYMYIGGIIDEENKTVEIIQFTNKSKAKTLKIV